MRLELLTQRRRGAYRRLVQVGDVRRRIGRWRIQQVVENPLAPQYWRRAGRVERVGHIARLREHAGPWRACQIDTAELRPGDTVDPVVLRQTLVEEAVLRLDEVENAAVLADDVVDEALRLAAHA